VSGTLRRDVPSGSLLNQLPWLLDANSWELEHHGSDPLDLNASGVWPLGNGRVFAHAGLTLPFNRLQGMVGPTYQSGRIWDPTGDFGDCWLELEVGGSVPWRRQGIWRPRESGLLVTRATDGRVSLVTIDAVLPIRPILIRVVEVWGAAQLGTDATVVVHLPAGRPHDPRRRTLRAEGAGGKMLLVGAGGGRAEDDGSLRVPLASVPREGPVARLCTVLAFGLAHDDPSRWLTLPHDPAVHLDEVRAHWKTWLAATTTPNLWPQNLPGRTSTERSLLDLIQLGKINLKMQQAVGGGVGPMVHFKGVWARDTNGPVRAFLRMGRLEEVQDQLEYSYRAAIAAGAIPNAARLDLPLARVPERSQWSDVPVPPAEVPSWIVLQHRWWLAAGGDVELVRRHWDYLRRCVLGQRVSPDGFLRFHGDETYLHGALYAVFPERCGWPNDLIAEDGAGGYAPWSLDSMVAYVAANEAMAWMSRAVGREHERAEYLRAAVRVRAAIEQHFWLDDRHHYAPAIYPLSGAPHPVPFAPINLRMLWLGFHRGDDPRGRRNLEAVIDLLGLTNTTPSCEYTVGHHPGYLLWALLQAGSDLAPLALAHLVASASPAAEWGEVHGPDGGPDAGYDRSAPNRLRPWEGGVNLDAIYHYFALRRARDEPDLDLRGIARRGGTMGFGPARAPDPPAVSSDPVRVVVVSADASEVAAAAERFTAGETGAAGFIAVEPGLPIDASYLEQLLFGPEGRRADVLVLGASALRGDRRSMKPERFWRLPAMIRLLERFEEDGGTLLRPTHH
jgi:hypothetical protein